MKHASVLDEVIRASGSRFREEDRVKRREFGARAGLADRVRREGRLRVWVHDAAAVTLESMDPLPNWLAWPLADPDCRAGLVKPEV